MTAAAAYELSDLFGADGRQALEHLRVRARRLVTGMLHGGHRSRRKGVSTEFDHHALYQPGDPLKLIDWKASARHDRIYVKRQLEDTALQVRLVVDRSGSMRRATGTGPTKYLQAARLATALAFVILEERDRFGLTIAGSAAGDRSADGKTEAWLPAGSGETHLVRFVKALCTAEGSGRDGLAEPLRVQVERSERRGLTVLISDLMFDPGPVQSQLARLAAQGHDLLVFQVCDPVEQDFPFSRWIRFQSLEAGGRGRRIDTVPLKRLYREEFAAVQEEWRAWCRRSDAHFCIARSDAAMETVLAEYLSFRERIGR